jgi:hypothetical protein
MAGFVWKLQIIVKISYNVVEGTEYFVSFEMSVILIEEYNFMIDREKLIVTTARDSVHEVSHIPILL